MARGTVFVGFFASAAVIPTISVPIKEKPAESKTFIVPSPPPAKAPGFFQYSNPITLSPRPPVVTHKAINLLLICSRIIKFIAVTNNDKNKDN